MSKGDTEEQRARDRLREKLHRVRGPRKKVPPKITGRKVCIVCGITKAIKQFSTHAYAPDGRRYNCRLCGWEERWHRQLEWSAKHMPDGGTRRDMRARLGLRQPEKTPKVWEYWWRSYADLGFEKRRFGDNKVDTGERRKPFSWRKK